MKTKSNNAIVYVFLLIVAFLSLPACSNDEQEKKEQNVTIDGKEYRITSFSITPTEGSPLGSKQVPEDFPLEFHIMNEQTKEVISYQTRIHYTDDGKVICDMFIPTDTHLQDGTYFLIMIFNDEKERYPLRLSLAFKDGKCEWFGSYIAPYEQLKGQGSPDNPFQIQTYKDLFYMAEGIRNDTLRGAGFTFKQMATIDLENYYNDPDRHTDQYWTPIADGFAGTYDGGKKTISHLRTKKSNTASTGFFESLGDGAEVRNLNFTNVSLENATANSWMGTVTGKTKGNVRLIGINATGNFETTGSAGGLIGQAEGELYIENCGKNIKIMAKAYVGGLVGQFTGTKLTILNSATQLDAQTTGNYSGGVVGQASGIVRIESTTVQNGTILGGNFVGGIAGQIRGSLILNNSGLMATSSLRSTELSAYTIEGKGSDVGGLIGAIETSGTDSQISLCYFNSDLIGASEVGGLIGRASGSNAITLTDNRVGQKGGSVTGKNYVGGYIGRSGVSLQIKADIAIDEELIKIMVSGSGERTGGIIGKLEDGSSAYFTQVKMAANVSGSKWVGGFVGEGTNLTFDDCSTTSTIKITGKECVGGVAGSAAGVSFNGKNRIYSANVNNSGSYTTSAIWVGGLFGYLRDATLESVTVNSQVMSGDTGGGLIGVSEGKVELLNCTSNTHVEVNTSNAGGLIGSARGHDLLIRNCVNNGVVHAKQHNIGGLVGITRTNYSIQNSKNTGEVSSLASGDRVGGIIGFSYEKSAIKYTINTGAVSGRTYIGGIVGGTDEDRNKTDYLDLTYCANKGYIKASTKDCGGLVGLVFGHFRINMCYNAGFQEGNENTGGIVGEIIGGYTAGEGDQRINDCYNTGASSGGTHRAGIMGYKGSDAGVNSLIVRRCYNMANTGWGIFGGISNTASYRYENIYYLNNGGDLNNAGKPVAFENLGKKESFGGFDFESTWIMEGHPKLKNNKE